jgi:hypothetical protein
MDTNDLLERNDWNALLEKDQVRIQEKETTGFSKFNKMQA